MSGTMYCVKCRRKTPSRNVTVRRARNGRMYQTGTCTVCGKGKAGWVFPCWVKLSRRLHSWWCPSVNSFKFQLCNHTSPGTHRLRFPGGCPPSPHEQTTADRQLASFMVRTTTVSDRLRTSDFRSWLMKTSLANAFAVVRLAPIQEFHL